MENRETFIKMLNTITSTQLYEYQWDVLMSNSTFSIVRKSRRVGYSFLSAFEGLIKSHQYKKYTRQFVSYNLDDAKEKIKEAKELYEEIPKTLRKKLRGDTKTSLEFLDYDGKSVSRLISIPCRPPRGKGGDVILDEFAFYQDPHKIYTASLPVLTGGENEECAYKLQIGSTAFAGNSLFKDIWTDTSRYPYERFDIYWWECPRLCIDIITAKKLAPKMLTEERVERFGATLLKEIYQNISEPEFQQEYELTFLEEQESFIPWSWVQRAANIDEWYNKIDEIINDSQGEFYLGVDIGRHHHYTEFVFIRRYGDIFKVDGVISISQMELEKQQKFLEQILNSKKVIRCCIDKTGIGLQLGESLEKKFPSIVEGIHFTQESKTRMCNEIYIAFERNKLQIIRDKDFMMQINSVKRSYSISSRYPKFDVESGKHHADKYWGLALAFFATVNVDSFAKVRDMYKELKATALAEKNTKKQNTVLEQILKR